MNAESSYRSYNLDHLGLVAGMVDELGLPELIDTVIKQDPMHILAQPEHPFWINLNTYSETN